MKSDNLKSSPFILSVLKVGTSKRGRSNGLKPALLDRPNACSLRKGYNTNIAPR